MTSPWTDLERPGLSGARLQRDLGRGPVWREIRVVSATVSTQADVAAAARTGAEEGLVVVAEEQTAGRGRLDRRWSAPPRSGLLMSWLLRPGADPARWTLLPLLAGLAVVDALGSVAAVEADLKWPNDVMVGDRKLAGVLAERVADAVVVGVGLNVSMRREELPVATATSVGLEGGVTDREVLAKELLRVTARRYLSWLDTPEGDAVLIHDYRARCATIGRQVRIEAPGGDVVTGRATDVDPTGRLVVVDPDGAARAWSAGDVTHLRALPPTDG